MNQHNDVRLNDPAADHNYGHPVTVLLDMDGVCCDFVGMAARVMGIEDPYGAWPKDHPTHDMTSAFGIDADEMWSRIDEQGSLFWRYLQPYPWFDEMYAKITEIAPVVFCTSPPGGRHGVSAVTGKVEWLLDRFGDDFRCYVLTNRKHLLADDQTILIDDQPDKCGKFRKAGGRAFTFPQPWNDSTFDPDNVVEQMTGLVRKVADIYRD